MFCFAVQSTYFYLRLYGVGHMVKGHRDNEWCHYFRGCFLIERMCLCVCGGGGEGRQTIYMPVSTEGSSMPTMGL